MSDYLFHFSPTGGTKKTADAVLSSWSTPFQAVNLLQPSAQKRFTSQDRCLFAVPSFGGRVPTPAVDRIREFSGNGAQAILLVSFGNRAIDDTLLELSDELQTAGFRPVAAIEAVAQHSLLPQFGAGRPDAQDVEELAEFGRKIQAAMEAGTLSAHLQLPGNRPYREYNGVPLKPTVSDGCIGCGLCAAECPTGAIPLLNFRTTDGRKCITCMHCVAVCPAHVRKVNPLMVLAISQKLKKACSGRKENRLYL